MQGIRKISKIIMNINNIQQTTPYIKNNIVYIINTFYISHFNFMKSTTYK